MEEYYHGSRGSSSTSDNDPKAKIKDCCRKIIAFMCTQVGLGALVFSYTLVGAISFMSLEQKGNNTEPNEINKTRQEYLIKLYNVALKHNIFDVNNFSEDTNKVLKNYQEKVVEIFKYGYSERSTNDMWTFSAALMFSLGVITMIGYGNLVPKTPYGKLVTVIYALFGIPLYILFFLNVGDALAGGFRWIYRKLYRCSTLPEEETDIPKRIIVPSSACIWVMVTYVLAGAAVFSAWEGWGFLDSVYFSVTSLCKIGMGDFVPGAHFANTTKEQTEGHSKLVLSYVYIFFGLGLVAMCYNLMREEIREKVKNIREDFAQCLEDTRLRIVECCKKIRGTREEYYY
ncbi:potassium channel subfamily K member 15 [Diorhabda carinulata]|uniref:potassium channel subfamily K member 15 n=1 Tax=Diorhabda carinulata TaxID=1163345 RepID=UPI0025A12948|nr:potassium channel subfamily K member 15 [Diorhabda carinulata]